MSYYQVVQVDSEGFFLDDPAHFDNRSDAVLYADKQAKENPGTTWDVYYCRLDDWFPKDSSG